MKKKIVIGLAIFSLISLLGGVYIIASIHRTTAMLDNLIALHQVEIMREQLLIDAKVVQSDLAFKHTHYAAKLETLVDDVMKMAEEADRCSQCHRSDHVTGRIDHLRNNIEIYKKSMSRVLTMRGSGPRLETEENKAYQAGQDLVDLLNSMTFHTKVKLESKTESSLREIKRTQRLLFIFIFGGPLLALGLAVVFVKGLTRPVNVLLQATRKLKGGDLAFRIQGLRDEFGEVADSFNDMADSLRQQILSMARAEQMTVVGEMAAGLVHEIKNPLAGIKASIQVLLQEGNIRPEEAMILSKVLEEVQRIEALMKNLLNFARPSRPQMVPINMNDVLDSTLTFSAPYSSLSSGSSRAIDLKKNLDAGIPPIMADPVQMQQVFLNVIMNALEAMPGGGTLTVTTSAGRPAGSLRIEIADSGKGLSPAELGKLFQPFFTTKHKGTGLGLAISRQFVEMHGGTITIENREVGGTVCTILLPIRNENEMAQ
jgi:signal transduction histidine kinase